MDELLDIAVLESDSDSDLKDLLLLNIMNPRENVINRANIHGAFSLDELSEQECKLYFRF